MADPRPLSPISRSGRRCSSVRLFCLSLALSLAGCLAGRPFDEARWREQADGARVADLYAPHREPSGRYFNPWLPQEKSSWDFWRWKLSRRAAAAEAAEDDPSGRESAPVPNDGAYLRDPTQPASLTHVGHATFVLQWGGPVVVTDPFFSTRAAVIRRLVPPAFGPEAVPDGAVAIVSHNHYDHLDAASVAALGRRVTFLCPTGLGAFLREKGAESVLELGWWEVVEVGGTRFTCLPAQHWSRRLGQGRNETLWSSWLLERDGRRVYFGGDSGYFVGYREFGRRFPEIDVALLPIGAYLPRWFMHYSHMDIPEVLRAFEELGARRLVPTQWGVLPLGDEPPAWPATELRRAAAARPELRARVTVLPVGGRLLLDGGG